MKSRRGLVVFAAALVLTSIVAVQEARAINPKSHNTTRVWNTDPLGVSPLLAGKWQNGDPGRPLTDITLQNPTTNRQLALIIYYDDNEKFLQCVVKDLSTHDIDTFSPPVTDFFGTTMLFKGGAFEVVTTAARGLQTHTVYQGTGGNQRKVSLNTEHDGLVGSYTTRPTAKGIASSLPLHQVNFKYFSPPEDTSNFSACVCPKTEGDFNFLPGVSCNE